MVCQKERHAEPNLEGQGVSEERAAWDVQEQRQHKDEKKGSGRENQEVIARRQEREGNLRVRHSVTMERGRIFSERTQKDGHWRPDFRWEVSERDMWSNGEVQQGWKKKRGVVQEVELKQEVVRSSGTAEY